jgi:hypothetical protein
MAFPEDCCRTRSKMAQQRNHTRCASMPSLNDHCLYSPHAWITALSSSQSPSLLASVSSSMVVQHQPQHSRQHRDVIRLNTATSARTTPNKPSSLSSSNIIYQPSLLRSSSNVPTVTTTASSLEGSVRELELSQKDAGRRHPTRNSLTNTLFLGEDNVKKR